MKLLHGLFAGLREVGDVERHQLCPCHVVVAILAGLAELFLFQMGHPMHQRGQRGPDLAIHRLRVQGDLARLVTITVTELFGPEIAMCATLAGQSEHHGRQAVFE